MKTIAILLPLLSFPWIIGQVHAVAVLARQYHWHCDLQEEQIVELRWDEPTETYIVLEKKTFLDGYEEAMHNSDSKNNNNNNNNRNRKLEYEPISSPLLRGGNTDEVMQLDAEAAIPVSTRPVEETRTARRTESKPSVFARRCPCWNPMGIEENDFYCPIPRTHCGLGADWTSYNSSRVFVYDDPGCLDVKRQQSFARNVWPIVTVWYLATLLCLCMTRPGQHAMGCCISKIWPGWNVHAANRIMRHNPHVANRVIFRHMAEETRTASWIGNRLSYAGFEVTFELAPASTNETVGEEVVLRTKTFRYEQLHTHGGLPNGSRESEEKETSDQPENQRSEENTSDDSGSNGQNAQSSTFDIPDCGDVNCNAPSVGENVPNDHYNIDGSALELVCCTICHLEIEDGERVGDLPCGHTFHIECLKAWIPRRNVCPLCLAKDIATPRYSSNETATEQSFPRELVVSGE